MTERDTEEQRRLRRAAAARFGPAPEAVEDESLPVGTGSSEPAEEDDNAASQRMEQQTMWVDFQIRKAMERGEFDNLPGTGKPLNLPDTHDPDWWVKRLIEREQIQGVAPPAIGLRREDDELDGVLDREWAEEGVRRVVVDFNRRVVEARRQLTGGPPVVTKLRDEDHEVERWRDRRTERREASRQRRAAEAARVTAEPRTPRRTRRAWWRRTPR